MTRNIPQIAEKGTNRREFLLQHGDVVRVQDFSGELLERRVWGVAERVVYVCTERLFRALELGLERTPPIGFPKGDVRTA